MTEVHLEVVGGVALVAGAYVAAWRTASERPRPARVGAFAAALLALVAATIGPLHDLGERGMFSAHMAQHLILMLIVPPLLLVGTPSFMIDPWLRPLLARRAGAWTLGTLTRPLPALGAYAVALFVWHLPGPYRAALAAHPVHLLEHATLLATALLAWWPVLSPSRVLAPLPYAAQLLYLFVFGMPMTIVAAMITGADHVLYPLSTALPGVAGPTILEDQRLGGILMWVPAGIIPLVAFTAVFFRWAAAESEDRAEAESSTPS